MVSNRGDFDGHAYGSDLRKRDLDAANAGGSARWVAKRFGDGVTTAIV